MKWRPGFVASILMVWLVACATPPTTAPSPAAPTPTSVPQALEPPTAQPASVAPSQLVNCAGPSGTPLAATFYGRGSTAVIFSNRSDKGQDSWKPVAQQTAAAGYLAVTYDYRGHKPDGSEDNAKLNEANLDLRAVIACARAQGEQDIVLVGASLGGMASAKEAGPAQAAALIIVSSPMRYPDFTLTVGAAELQNAVPKLFIASEHDPFAPAAETQAMYQAAAEPKTFYQYTGDAHGTDLLLGAWAQDFQQRLLDFIKTHAPV